MKKFSFYFLMLLAVFTFGLHASDTMIIEHNGKTYECTSVNNGGGSNCWNNCPYTFITCVESCGGGSQCWDKCPYSFGTCVDSCGSGSKCWDNCPYIFGTCAESCGGGSKCWEKCPYTFGTCSESCGGRARSVNDELYLKFLLSHGERIEKEIEDFGMPYSEIEK